MSRSLYESPLLREITGDILRPGGLEPTARALEICAFPPDSRLLDAGCGVGGTLKYLQEQGFSCLGVERRADFAAEAARHGPVLRADLTAMPLADAGFSGVFCECVLSLFADKRAVLREFFRVLAPGGRLILTDLCSPQEADEAARGPNGCATGAVPLPTLKNILRENGFVVAQHEDYSRALRELAAHMAWRAGGVAAFLQQAGVGSPCACSGSLSYHLIIAEKRRMP
jgi:ubiquinone/menaquinone biosynthesis C-methylase UbiE